MCEHRVESGTCRCRLAAQQSNLIRQDLRRNWVLHILQTYRSGWQTLPAASPDQERSCTCAEIYSAVAEADGSTRLASSLARQTGPTYCACRDLQVKAEC
jgi:hypothetical protein